MSVLPGGSLTYQEWIEYVDSLPKALESRYGDLGPNQNITLFEGNLVFTDGENRWPAQGHVQFCWLPRPALRFNAAIDGESGVPDRERVGLHIPQVGIKQTALITEKSHTAPSRPTPLAGLLADSRWSNPQKSYSRVYFHLANFNRFYGDNVRRETSVSKDRVSLQWRDFTVTIDHRANAEEVRKEVRRSGGYGVSHVGRITRTAGDGISPNEITFLLSGLHWFCTFVRGIRCGPVLTWATSDSGEVSEHWRAPDLDPRIRPNLSWFPELHPSSLSELFPAFMDRFDDHEWRRPLKQALEWYASANKQESKVDGSHVQAITALEVLGSLELPSELDSLGVANRIRKLLGQSPAISPKIPSDMKSVRQTLEVMKKHRPDRVDRCDGPEAIAQFRHVLVHPSERNRRALGELARGHRIRLRDLALWYFELCLLRCFGYTEEYSNRLDRNRFWNDSELVPWAIGD